MFRYFRAITFKRLISVKLKIMSFQYSIFFQNTLISSERWPPALFVSYNSSLLFILFCIGYTPTEWMSVFIWTFRGSIPDLSLHDFLYASLKPLRHHWQKQSIGPYRPWVRLSLAIVGFCCLLVFIPCPANYCLLISVLPWCCAYTELDKILVSHFILQATLLAVQNWFCCLFVYLLFPERMGRSQGW